MSIVDGMDIPVGEKVLRLQSSLTGKALALVKRAKEKSKGKSNERAKEKLKISIEKRDVCRLNT